MGKKLFETAKLGNLTLKNPLVRSATWEGVALPDGSVTEEAYEIYDELAKGGVGAIITGFTSAAHFNHIPTHDQNKLIFIEKTGHTYQMKHQEVADDILQLVQEWRA